MNAVFLPVEGPDKTEELDRHTLAKIICRNADELPFKVLSRRTNNKLAAFDTREKAVSFINNICYESLLC